MGLHYYDSLLINGLLRGVFFELIIVFLVLEAGWDGF